MKTVTLRGTRRARTLVASLCLALLAMAPAACALEDAAEEEIATEAQAVGASCTIQRPFAWTVGSAHCSEGPFVSGPITLFDGDEFEFYANYGDGYAVARCDNGVWLPLKVAVCAPTGGGSPQ